MAGYATRRINDLYAACTYCGRNKHKVVVKRADGLYEGYCPSCWKSVEDRLQERGEVVIDRRQRV